MKQLIQKRIVFLTKSMLWSLLLYAVMMLAFNWDDVSRNVSGKDAVAVVCDTPAQQAPYGKLPAGISKHTRVIKSIVSIMKTISGFTSISVDR